MNIDLTKLEMRELLRVIATSDIDDDLHRKLQASWQAANRTTSRFETVIANGGDPPSYQRPYEIIVPADVDHATLQRLLDSGYEPVRSGVKNFKEPEPVLVAREIVWTPELAAQTKAKTGADLTQADVDLINEQHRKAVADELAVRANYRPQLSTDGFGVVTAAFVAPDRPKMPGYRESFAVGETNYKGDVCVQEGAYLTAVFRCAKGHGYNHNATNDGCHTCWMIGDTTPVEQQEDLGAVDGADSRW